MVTRTWSAALALEPMRLGVEVEERRPARLRRWRWRRWIIYPQRAT
jgi:hypothetical protein